MITRRRINPETLVTSDPVLIEGENHFRAIVEVPDDPAVIATVALQTSQDGTNWDGPIATVAGNARTRSNGRPWFAVEARNQATRQREPFVAGTQARVRVQVNQAADIQIDGEAR